MRRRIKPSRSRGVEGRRNRLRVEGLESRCLLSGDAAAGGILQAYGRTPLSFEPNRGQTDSQVQFLSRGAGYTLFVTPTEAVLSLAKAAGSGGKSTQAAPTAVLRMTLVGANSSPTAAGLDRLPGVSNDLIGNNPSKWQTDVPNFAKVEERGVYPGVDLTYYGNQQVLEYDFNVAPWANPGAIRLAFQGADATSLDAQGDLVLHTSGGDVVEQAPVLYQVSAGVRQAVSGHYVIGKDGQVGFAVGSYDASKPLVIDPVLSYSTYLGGIGIESGSAIAVDAAGDAYITGSTGSTDFPTTANSLQPVSDGGTETFVTKLSADGSTLIYSTYLGGSDGGRGIAVDAAGEAYITGQTTSNNLPTLNAIQPAFGGGSDAFVAKLNAAGSALIYSTYLGGAGQDQGNGIAVDAAGNAYVTGETASISFPVAHAFEPAYSGGDGDVFVTKISADGSTLDYSTYLGGSGTDNGNGIAVDAAGDAYVTGFTFSTEFPTANAFQPIAGGAGGTDAFVTKFSPDGSSLLYSTYLGGTGGDDVGNSIAVDAAGDAYVTGSTGSTDFPVVNALQPNFGPGRNSDVFVSKFNASGSALDYSTFLGGNDSIGGGIAVDAAGEAYVTGLTSSTHFPTVNAIQPTFAGGSYDSFVSKLNAAGSALIDSTYLGGSGTDNASGIAVDAAGAAYVTGFTSSTNFPTANAFQPTPGNLNENVFITKIEPTPGPANGVFTELFSSSNPSVTGQTVTFTARVTKNGTLAGSPTGTVRFQEGTTVLATGTLDANGQATYTTSTLSAGRHTITAYYEGDGTFAPSSGTNLQIVQAATPIATNTTLTSSLNPSIVGQSVTLTATATGANSGTPTGTVTFQDGSTFLAAVKLDGRGAASFSTANLGVGTHSISASYAGDTTFSPSNGAVTQTVQSVVTRIPSTTTLTSSPNPSFFGQTVTFTATVNALTNLFATGTISFLDGSLPLGTSEIDASGRATISVATLSTGNHFIYAIYGGDSDLQPSTSVADTQIVFPAPKIVTTTALTSAPNPSIAGGVVVFTATVASASGIPIGIVTFRDGTDTLGTSALDATGRATFTISTLSTGTHAIMGFYGAEANFVPSISPIAFQTVIGAGTIATSTSLTSAPNPSIVGGAVAFTATVGSATGIPTGIVTFEDGTVALGTAALDNTGRATLSVTTLAAGTHAITAIYSGDPRYAPSTSPVDIQMVNAVIVGPPRVVMLSRFGYHLQPTVLVLTFSQPLDPSTAQNPLNYRLIGPNGRAIGVFFVSYNPIAGTVTLFPSQMLNIHHRYDLTVVGSGPSGVRGADGVLLDGSGLGRPGTNYEAVIDRSTLVIPQPATRLVAHPHARAIPSARHKVAPIRPARHH